MSDEADRLRAVEALYEAGDFREVNRQARELAEKAEDETIRGRAQQLVDRVQVDPFVLWAWGGTVLVIVAVIYLTVLR